MIFLYSRKSQLLLLACWTIGMTFMYMQITGEKPLWLIKADQRITARHQKARLGQMPALPEPPPRLRSQGLRRIRSSTASLTCVWLNRAAGPKIL